MPTKTHDYVTKKELADVLDKRLEEQTKAITNDIGQQIDRLSFMIQEKFDEIDNRLDKIEKTIEKLVNVLDSHLMRIENIETENSTRDLKYERLLAWAKKVSAKTGIPLEY